MIFQGPVITDTHQQDCEMARVEVTVDGNSLEGRFATLFCIWGGEPNLTADGYQPFRGRVIERLHSGVLIAELQGRFRCHYFDCTTLYMEIRGRTVLLYEHAGDRAVTLYAKYET